MMIIVDHHPCLFSYSLSLHTKAWIPTSFPLIVINFYPLIFTLRSKRKRKPPWQIPQILVDRIPRTPPDKLRGRALEWCRINRGFSETWADYSYAFREYFLPGRYQTHLADRYGDGFKAPAKGGRDFASTIQNRQRSDGHRTVDRKN